MENRAVKIQEGRTIEYFMQKKYLLAILIFAAYCIFAFIANWSILTGDNLMKWDIY